MDTFSQAENPYRAPQESGSPKEARALARQRFALTCIAWLFSSPLVSQALNWFDEWWWQTVAAVVAAPLFLSVAWIVFGYRARGLADSPWRIAALSIGALLALSASFALSSILEAEFMPYLLASDAAAYSPSMAPNNSSKPTSLRGAA